MVWWCIGVQRVVSPQVPFFGSTKGTRIVHLFLLCDCHSPVIFFIRTIDAYKCCKSLHINSIALQSVGTFDPNFARFFDAPVYYSAPYRLRETLARRGFAWFATAKRKCISLLRFRRAVSLNKVAQRSKFFAGAILNSEDASRVR
jgi:hypothetical protein